MTQEALKQALEALENISTALREDDVLGSDSELMLNAITAIKEALEESENDELIIRYHEMTIKRLEKRIEELTAQPEQEPVARVIDNGTPEGATEWIPFKNRVEPLETGDLLYTTPPQRPWIGLTGQEKELIASVSLGVHDAVHRTDAKLKDKNT